MVENNNNTSFDFDSDIVIGLEIHVELATKTKLFCGCARSGNDEPNTRTCPVCLGHPGSKPVLNKKAVEYALKVCLALGCKISPELIFSRKSYFYPDMSKNYQITQYEQPLGIDGSLKLRTGKKIGIVRVHMEEDPASIIHPSGMGNSSYVLIDYNRSGDPLCEIVTKPDMTCPSEAREFLKRLIEVINYLEVFDIDSCIIKADANVSIKESGYVRSEIKNVTGFKEIERALEYELKRQRKAIKEGNHLIQETRAWDPDAGVTKAMRTKETEEDYGYIIDPDLTITDITDEMIESIKQQMPELAWDKVEKFVNEYGVDRVDAEVLASDRLIAEMFEKISKHVDPVSCARWIRRELLRVLNYNKLTMKDIKFNHQHLIELLKLVEDKKITQNVSKRIIEELVLTPFDIHDYIKRNDLLTLKDDTQIKDFCNQVINSNPAAVEEYLQGKQKALNFLVGQVMKLSKGKASPSEVNAIITELIKGR